MSDYHQLIWFPRHPDSEDEEEERIPYLLSARAICCVFAACFVCFAYYVGLLIPEFSVSEDWAWLPLAARLFATLALLVIGAFVAWCYCESSADGIAERLQKVFAAKRPPGERSGRRRRRNGLLVLLWNGPHRLRQRIQAGYVASLAWLQNKWNQLGIRQMLLPHETDPEYDPNVYIGEPGNVPAKKLWLRSWCLTDTIWEPPDIWTNIWHHRFDHDTNWHRPMRWVRVRNIYAVPNNEQVQPAPDAASNEQVQPVNAAPSNEQVQPVNAAPSNEQVQPVPDAARNEQVQPVPTAARDEQVQPVHTAPSNEQVQTVPDAASDEQVQPIDEGEGSVTSEEYLRRRRMIAEGKRIATEDEPKKPTDRGNRPRGIVINN